MCIAMVHITLALHILGKAFHCGLVGSEVSQTHTAVHLAEAKAVLMEEWVIKRKVRDQSKTRLSCNTVCY